MGVRGRGGDVKRSNGVGLHDPQDPKLFRVWMGSCAIVSRFPCDSETLRLTGVVSILWAAVFGVFGKMYIHENPEGNRGVGRMKNAVWIDLINMLLWFFTSIFAAVWFFFLRGRRSLHTGRATV